MKLVAPLKRDVGSIAARNVILASETKFNLNLLSDFGTLNV
jgi:hypothetical protein